MVVTVMSKILITGANGYIGSHVLSELLKIYPAQDLTAIDFRNTNIPLEVNYINFDILNNAKNPELFKLLGNPEICIHLAWQDGFNHASEKHIDSLSAHYHFLKNLIDNDCRSISVMGTMHEVGYYEGCVDEETPCFPLSLYGIAKNSLRQMLLAYIDNKAVSLKWLRAFYITGDDDSNKSVFSKIIQLAEEGKTSFPFTDGKNKYDFIDVEVLASQIVHAALQNDINGIINCCSGKAVSLKDKVEKFIAKKQLSIRPEYGVYPSRKYDSPAIWGDTKKINQIMGR